MLWSTLTVFAGFENPRVQFNNLLAAPVQPGQKAPFESHLGTNCIASSSLRTQLGCPWPQIQSLKHWPSSLWNSITCSQLKHPARTHPKPLSNPIQSKRAVAPRRNNFAVPLGPNEQASDCPTKKSRNHKPAINLQAAPHFLQVPEIDSSPRFPPIRFAAIQIDIALIGCFLWSAQSSPEPADAQANTLVANAGSNPAQTGTAFAETSNSRNEPPIGGAEATPPLYSRLE